VKGGTGGARLPQLANTAPAWSTDVFGSSNALADERVRSIISANQAGPALPATAARARASADLLANARLGASHAGRPGAP
jgi:hypothetical protein